MVSIQMMKRIKSTQLNDVAISSSKLWFYKSLNEQQQLTPNAF